MAKYKEKTIGIKKKTETPRTMVRFERWFS
jgi:hypothetical protein